MFDDDNKESFQWSSTLFKKQKFYFTRIFVHQKSTKNHFYCVRFLEVKKVIFLIFSILVYGL